MTATMTDTIRVVLADDHTVVRAGLKAVLGGAKDIHVIGEVSNGRDAIAMVQRMNPEVLVMDLSMDPIDGAEATKQLVAATFGRGLFRYSLANPLAVLRGDVNRDGKVDAFDALLIQQALVGLQLDNGLTVLPSGDADCNTRLEAADVLLTLRAAVGLTTTGACVGNVR